MDSVIVGKNNNENASPNKFLIIVMIFLAVLVIILSAISLRNSYVAKNTVPVVIDSVFADEAAALCGNVVTEKTINDDGTRSLLMLDSQQYSDEEGYVVILEAFAGDDADEEPTLFKCVFKASPRLFNVEDATEG